MTTTLDQRVRTRPRGPLLVFVIAVWVVLIYGAWVMTTTYVAVDHLGLDAHAYWDAARRADPYALPPGFRDAYLYSPAFLQVVSLVAWLPWPAFLGLWIALQTWCFWWLTRQLAWWWQVPVMLLCLPEILYGNIHGLLGVMLCLAARRPGLWAFALLTKVTFGAVGIVWFLARKDWRALGEIAVVTGAVMLVSMLVDLQSWLAWVTFLATTGDGESHWFRVLRLLLVVGVVAFAARTDRPWVMPLAMLTAAPRFSLHIKDLSILAATVRLVPQSASRRRTRGMTSSP